MGVILRTDDRGVKIFANEREYSGGKFTAYSMGISSKDKDGNYINGYLDVSFKKGVEVENGTVISFDGAFPIVREGAEKRKYYSWKIMDFEVIKAGEQSNGSKAQTSNPDEFMKIPDDIDEELPFL